MTLGGFAQIAMDCAFKRPVGVCHPSVLPQMLGPRFDKERFDKLSGVGGILKYAPCICAVAPSFGRKSIKSYRNGCRSFTSIRYSTVTITVRHHVRGRA